MQDPPIRSNLIAKTGELLSTGQIVIKWTNSWVQNYWFFNTCVFIIGLAAHKTRTNVLP